MSDTPRTDAKRAEILDDALGLEYEANELRNFAEQLERELIAAVRERDEARTSATEANITLTATRQLYREARAECERLREDAHRYRWLRRVHENWDVLMRESEDACWQDVWGDRLDAAIDKARGKT